MSLRSGEVGKSRISLKGKGAKLNDPATLFSGVWPLPLVAQLQSSTGACFETEFDAPGVSLNNEERFKASGGSLD
jgi:hypothetical protein